MQNEKQVREQLVDAAKDALVVMGSLMSNNPDYPDGPLGSLTYTNLKAALSTAPERTREELALSSAAHALIGYTQSLRAGTVITQDYVDRINDYYVPNLINALKVR